MEGRTETGSRIIPRIERMVCWYNPWRLLVLKSGSEGCLEPTHVAFFKYGLDRLRSSFASSTRDLDLVSIDDQRGDGVSVQLKELVLVGIKVRVKDHHALQFWILQKSVDRFPQPLTRPAPRRRHFENDGRSGVAHFFKARGIKWHQGRSLCGWRGKTDKKCR